MSEVRRIFVQKKKGFDIEAKLLLGDIRQNLSLPNITGLKIVNRYDVEGLTDSEYEAAKTLVFSEPPQDDVFDETYEIKSDETAFATEFLPGQYDQRAASAAECIQILTKKERPNVKAAKLIVLTGDVSSDDLEKVKKYLINPVESQEASMEKYDTLKMKIDYPEDVKVVEGFIDATEEELGKMLKTYGFAMDLEDIKFCRKYFKETEKRDPYITELRMIDTYWSDHCRHTTFSTVIDDFEFTDKAAVPYIEKALNEYFEARAKLYVNKTKPVCLMDMGTIAPKLLKSEGYLKAIDESEEINACSIETEVEINGKKEKYLIMFKNETHNHPTEIEPFGGAATCLGGAIRDPLSGRAYVYQAMRVTGSGDPRKTLSETIPGKLMQRKITTGAASGYSSYGNQIGLATGQVAEIYDEGYVAKRMEIGAVIAAVPKENVVRERPMPGDIIVLLGGRTGRDGCGGATGSSKAHTEESLETCGAEVQKGNPPVERKLQRLFRNGDVTRLIKRCNDFGAGGVSVAIGELADGLVINLDKVPKKYEGLDGTELAISESQERMAVVVEAKDVDRFVELATSENLEATVVAKVKAEPRLTMTWNGKIIVDLSREFLNSNGAAKHIDIMPENPKAFEKKIVPGFKDGYKALADDLNICSKRGLSERFDSTIGAGTVLMPFGGKNQLTPIQAMVNKVSVEKKHTDTCSFMAWGYNPFIMEKSPYHGAYLAVVESVAKLIASGASFEDVYLTFQEYFLKPEKNPARWGQPLSALLGAFKAQMDYEIASIGGKDSMSGTFEDIDVPPTLVSFAVTTGNVNDVVSPEFKSAGHKVVILKPEYDENGLPTAESEKKLFDEVYALIKAGKVAACYTPTYGGIAEAVMKMCFGNGIGFEYNEEFEIDDIFGYNYGAFILELTTEDEIGAVLGHTCLEETIKYGNDEIELSALLDIYENKLEPIFSCNIKQGEKEIETFSYNAQSRVAPAIKVAKPKVLIPVFPGTNCEFDTVKALMTAGADPEIFVIKNLTAQAIAESVDAFAEKVKQSQIIFIPGGFSGGDEPDGSGKFITAFFRNGAVKEQVHELLKNRDGLMAGICNGFQALIKLGLVPYGEIIDTDENCPTLTYNTIGRHQSRLVRTRIASNKSPWLMNTNVGDVYTVPVSHGEGRFLCSDELVKELAANGQIATQYVDLTGKPTADIHFNPNNSVCAIEGITSPDGRVFGKMGHSERIGHGLYKNVDGDFNIGMFDAAVKYFK